MIALAVLALGLLGVAYAVGPAWRTPADELKAGAEADEVDATPEEREADVRALRAWSQAAGELGAGELDGPGTARLDPEEVPK
jgi:hypothetical protein